MFSFNWLGRIWLAAFVFAFLKYKKNIVAKQVFDPASTLQLFFITVYFSFYHGFVMKNRFCENG